jgi:Tol biopolymer transport system component
MQRLLALVALTLGIASLAACGGTADRRDDASADPRAGAPLPGTIVAVEQPDPQNSTENRIVVVGPRGRLRTIATLEGKPGYVPIVSVSPDGRSVAYEDLVHGIRVVDVDGGNDHAIATPRGGGGPAWSRDGRHLAFDTSGAYPDGLHGVIFTRDLRSGRTRRLTPRGENRDQLPAWLPDGRIVFQHDGATTHLDLWIMNADGSNRRRLTHDPDLEFHPIPSPDGKLIAVSVFHPTQHSNDVRPARVIDLDGRVVHELALNDTPNAWSSDGDQLLVETTRGVPAAEREHSEDYALWRVSLDGRAASPVADVPGPGTLQFASWSPGP